MFVINCSKERQERRSYFKMLVIKSDERLHRILCAGCNIVYIEIENKTVRKRHEKDRSHNIDTYEI